MGAADRARLHVRERVLAHHSGEPEVQDLYEAVVAPHRVGGLEVAMDELRLVCGHQPLPRLNERAKDFLPGGLRLQPRIEPLAAHVLHGDEHLTVMVTDLVNRDHVGMRQPSQRHRFAFEPLAVFWRGQIVLAQHLERDLAIELLVVGPVHRPHAALADLVHDDKAADASDHRLAAEEPFPSGSRDVLQHLSVDRLGLGIGRSCYEISLRRGARLHRGLVGIDGGRHRFHPDTATRRCKQNPSPSTQW